MLYEQDWLQMYRRDAATRQNGRCKYCKDRLTGDNITADHRVPVSAGGLTVAENIQAACRRCNQLKGSIPHERFTVLMKRRALPERLPRRFRSEQSDRRYRTRLERQRAARRFNLEVDRACRRILAFAQ